MCERLARRSLIQFIVVTHRGASDVEIDPYISTWLSPAATLYIFSRWGKDPKHKIDGRYCFYEVAPALNKHISLHRPEPIFMNLLLFLKPSNNQAPQAWLAGSWNFLKAKSSLRKGANGNPST